MTTDNKIQDAIHEFGANIVHEVVEVVAVSDPDGAYSLFEDMDMFDHQACVEMLYFE
jgi:hypothetical protein